MYNTEVKDSLIPNKLQTIIISTFISVLYSQCLVYSFIHSINNFWAAIHPRDEKARYLIYKSPEKSDLWFYHSIILFFSSWNFPQLGFLTNSKPLHKLQRYWSILGLNVSLLRIFFPQWEIPLRNKNRKKKTTPFLEIPSKQSSPVCKNEFK